MKHLFIVNPAAGKGKTLGLVPDIKKILDEKNEEYIIEYTQYPGHGREIATKHLREDAWRVYSVGGDGTLNEVLNGLMGYKGSLAVIPGGSGNDFFRSIAGTGTDDIIRRTIDGTEKPIDVGLVNGRYFINIASVGFDADVVLNAGILKEKTFLSGSAAYNAGILVTLLRSRGYAVQMSIDGKPLNKKILLTAIANGKYYGGGMLPTPEAVLDDGMFDICVVESLNMLKILLLFPKYIKGQHGSLKEVSFYRGKTIKIRCADSLPTNSDGEVERAASLKYEILPKAVNVVIPSPSSRAGRVPDARPNSSQEAQ